MQQSTCLLVAVVVLVAGALGACDPLGQAEPTPVTLDLTPRLPTLEVEMPLTPDPTPVVTTPTPDPDAMPPTEEDEAEPVTVTPPTAEEAPATPEAKPTPEAGETTPEAEETPEGEASPEAEEAAQTEQAAEGEETGAPDEEELIGQGEEVFAANCAACHQADGQGTADYPALDGNEFVTAEDPVPVIETVLHGRGQMPPFQQVLSDQEIAAAVSYIRNAWSNDAGGVSPEQVQEIKEGSD